MVARTWVHLLAILLASAALAGCTKDGGDDGDGNNTTTTPTGGTPGNGAPPGDTARPADFNLTDSGQITGPFSQSWDIEVENIGFTNAMVHFALTGVQAGAPPTAHVNLQLTDPDGGVVKSAVLGVGGEGDAVEWTLTASDLPAAGTYRLSAVAGSDAPLPSVGLANWELMAMVDY